MSSRRSRRRRQDQREYIHAVKKVLAKLALAHQSLQVPMGCDQNAHVDGNRFVSADAFHFAFFKHSQQLGLHGQRHIADFVQEDCAVLRLFELSRVACGRPGE